MAQPDFDNLLKEAVGLDSATVGSASVERGVRSRMASLGLHEKEEYWKQVRSSESELQELIETVVVPETWFFRDEETFAALVRLLSNSNSMLRLLSVPCCTGEEPYSLIMALLTAGLPREGLHVDAIDISARALERARRLSYSANSFRGVNLAFRERYFEKTPDGYLLTDDFADVVTFSRGNFLAPDVLSGAELYDVIFCRNLLIYFDRDTQEQAFRKLDSLLAPNGLLFMGSAEAFLAASNGFKSVQEPMAFAFRKNSASIVPTFSIPNDPVVKPARSLPPRLLPRREASTATLSIPLPPPPIPKTVDLAGIQKLADAGRLVEATALCEDCMKKQGASVDILYLFGLMKDALGDRDRADECYRKVLYLDPSHADALLHLALLAESRGDATGARRLRDRARRTQSAEAT